jgi:hypothetical protein
MCLLLDICEAEKTSRFASSKILLCHFSVRVDTSLDGTVHEEFGPGGPKESIALRKRSDFLSSKYQTRNLIGH